MGENGNGQILDIIRQHEIPFTERRDRLAGPHQTEGAARARAEAEGRMGAGSPHDIGDIFLYGT